MVPSGELNPRPDGHAAPRPAAISAAATPATSTAASVPGPIGAPTARESTQRDQHQDRRPYAHVRSSRVLVEVIEYSGKNTGLSRVVSEVAGA